MDIKYNENWIKLFGYQKVKNLLPTVLNNLGNPKIITIRSRKEAVALSMCLHNLGLLKNNNTSICRYSSGKRALYTRSSNLSVDHLKIYGLHYCIKLNKNRLGILKKYELDHLDQTSKTPIKKIEYKEFLKEVNKYLSK